MLTLFRDRFFFPDFIYTMRRLPRSGPFNSCQQITPRPRPHYTGGIWEQRFYFENVSNVFRPHDVGRIWERRFYFENALNVFRPHYTRGIWKRRFHAENAPNVLRPHYTGEIWKLYNHRLHTRLPCRHRHRSTFKMSSVHSEESLKQSRRFWIPSVWRVFPKSSVFVFDFW